MPQIIVKNIDKSMLKNLSEKLIDQLAKITGSSPDSFTIELSQNLSITPAYCFVDVYWFNRPLEMQDKVAQCITEMLLGHGVDEFDLCFHELKERKYYYNGKHYGK
jgi:hypothetical protein